MTQAEKINTEELGEKIVKVIKTIFDPEIPVDIYELGLIYDVFVNEDYAVKVLDDTYYSKLSCCRVFASGSRRKNQIN